MSFYDVDLNNVESVYLLLHTLETVTVLPEKRASAADLIVNVKRAIRSFNRNSTTSAHIVKDYGIDGYIELYRFPDWLDAASKDEVESYFDSHRREYYTPSAYDCTGQRFTNWCKLFRRHGHWYAYHSVGVDV